MENTTASDLFTKLGPPMPVPPAPPVADWSDPFYPVGEANDTATAAIPSVVSVATDASSCSLRSPDGTTVSAGSGDQVFENWTILSILQASSTSAAVVVLQRRFPEWSLIIYSSVQGEVLRLRKPVGTLETMHTPTYTFPADYFIQAASDPNDYIGNPRLQPLDSCSDCLSRYGKQGQEFVRTLTSKKLRTTRPPSTFLPSRTT